MDRKYISYKIEDVIRILVEEMGMENREELEEYLLEDGFELEKDIEDILRYKGFLLNKEV